MYAITIILEPIPGQAQALIDACLAALPPSRAEPGNLLGDGLTPFRTPAIPWPDLTGWHWHSYGVCARAWREAHSRALGCYAGEGGEVCPRVTF